MGGLNYLMFYKILNKEIAKLQFWSQTVFEPLTASALSLYLPQLKLTF